MNAPDVLSSLLNPGFGLDRIILAAATPVFATQVAEASNNGQS